MLNVDEERNKDVIKHPNAVPGEAHYRTRNYIGGLNERGAVEYSVVFDKRFATPDMLYDIVDVIIKNNYIYWQASIAQFSFFSDADWHSAIRVPLSQPEESVARSLEDK